MIMRGGRREVLIDYVGWMLTVRNESSRDVERGMYVCSQSILNINCNIRKRRIYV